MSLFLELSLSLSLALFLSLCVSLCLHICIPLSSSPFHFIHGLLCGKHMWCIVSPRPFLREVWASVDLLAHCLSLFPDCVSAAPTRGLW